MALFNYDLPYVACLPSCEGSGEVKVGQTFKFKLDQNKNPEWPDYVLGKLVAIFKSEDPEFEEVKKQNPTYRRVYRFEIDDATLQVGNYTTFDACSFTELSCYSCCDEIKDTLLVERIDDVTTRHYNFDGTFIDVVDIPYDLSINENSLSYQDWAIQEVFDKTNVIEPNNNSVTTIYDAFNRVLARQDNIANQPEKTNIGIKFNSSLSQFLELSGIRGFRMLGDHTPTGLCVDKKLLHVVSFEESAIYVLAPEANGKVVNKIQTDLPINTMQGVALEGQYYWIGGRLKSLGDPDSTAVLRKVNATTGKTVEIFSIPANGVAYDFTNNHLWCCTGFSSDPGQLIQVDPTDGNVLQTVNLPFAQCDGIDILPSGNFIVSSDEPNVNSSTIHEVTSAGAIVRTQVFPFRSIEHVAYDVSRDYVWVSEDSSYHSERLNGQGTGMNRIYKLKQSDFSIINEQGVLLELQMTGDNDSWHNILIDWIDFGLTPNGVVLRYNPSTNTINLVVSNNGNTVNGTHVVDLGNSIHALGIWFGDGFTEVWLDGTVIITVNQNAGVGGDQPTLGRRWDSGELNEYPDMIVKKAWLNVQNRNDMFGEGLTQTQTDNIITNLQTDFRTVDETNVLSNLNTVQTAIETLNPSALIGAESGLTDEVGNTWVTTGVTVDGENFDFKSDSPSLDFAASSAFYTDAFAAPFWNAATGFSMGGIFRINETASLNTTRVIAGVRDPNGNASVFIVASLLDNNAVFRNTWQIRYIVTSSFNTKLAERIFPIPVAGKCPFYLHANVNFDTDEIEIFIDGKSQGVDTMTDSPGNTDMTRAGFMNNFAGTNITDGEGQCLYIDNRTWGESEVESVMETWLGQPKLLLPETSLNYYKNSFAGKTWFKDRIKIETPLAIAWGLVGDRSLTNGAGETAVSNVILNDWAGKTTISSERIFGRWEDELNGSKHYIDGAQENALLDVGTYTVSSAVQSSSSSWVTRGVGIMAGVANTPFVGEVKDGFSMPNACYYNNALYTCHSSIFMDTRWVGKHQDGKPSQYVQTFSGVSLGDVNHAGMAIVPTANGVLQINTGHAGPQFHSYYFPNGDLSNPTTYVLGDANSGYSYPNATILDDGKVAVYVRGNINSGSGTHHYALLSIWDPEDGSGFTQDVAWANNNWRAYTPVVQHAHNNGKEYLCFLQNPRSFTTGWHESLNAIAYNVTDDIWHAPDGSTFGTAGVKGTDNAPRLASGIPWATDVSSGGWRLFEKGSFDQLETDYENCIFDETQLPLLKGQCIFTKSDGQADGGYSDNISVFKGEFTGTNVIESNEIVPTTGRSIAAFSSQKVVQWNNVTYFVIFSRYSAPPTGVGNEISSPYSFAWKGGEVVEVRKWVDDSIISKYRLDNITVADLNAIRGGSGREFTGVKTTSWTHPTIHPCKLITFDVFNGIQRDLQNT
jgi:hypothetical protein